MKSTRGMSARRPRARSLGMTKRVESNERFMGRAGRAMAAQIVNVEFCRAGRWELMRGPLEVARVIVVAERLDGSSARVELETSGRAGALDAARHCARELGAALHREERLIAWAVVRGEWVQLHAVVDAANCRTIAQSAV